MRAKHIRCYKSQSHPSRPSPAILSLEFPVAPAYFAAHMPRQFRLAAIDIDGTLIHGGSLAISDANRRAVALMQDTGIEVALASGRHHASMLSFAAQLPGVRWMVSSQGAEVSDTPRREIISKVFHSPAAARHLITLGRRLGYAIVVHADDNIYRLDAPEKIAAYTGLEGCAIDHLTDDDALARPLTKVMWTGAADLVFDIDTHPEVAALDATRVLTHTYLYELLPPGIDKGAGAARLAAHLAITGAETLAFGDAENDIPLFRWAGVSFAMPGRWPSARAAATHTAPGGPPETAFARAVEMALNLQK